MLTVTPLKPNCTMIETDTKIVCVSYQTNVAFFDKVTREYFKTTKKWSNTTNRHIKLFFDTLAERHHTAFTPRQLDQVCFDDVLT